MKLDLERRVSSYRLQLSKCWRIDAEIPIIDKSVIEDVSTIDHSTAKQLVTPNGFVDGQDEVVLACLVSGLVQMKVNEPDRNKNSLLNSEPELLQSDGKNLKAIFSCAASDGVLHSKQISMKCDWAVTGCGAKQNFYCKRSVFQNKSK